MSLKNESVVRQTSTALELPMRAHPGSIGGQRGYTTEPVREGLVQTGLPEFVRIGGTKGATYYTGLSRSKIYQGIHEGWVKSVSLRKKGQKFSVRLIHLASLVQYLRSLVLEQNPQMNPNDFGQDNGFDDSLTVTNNKPMELGY